MIILRQLRCWTTKFFFSLLFIVSYLNFASAKETATQVITLASDKWCPFYCTTSEKVGPGILVEVINAALKNSNFKIEYKFINWARALDMAQKNDLNGVIGAYISDVPSFLVTEKPPAVSKDCFYSAKKTQWKYVATQNSEQLKGHRIGSANGYSYGDKLDAFKNSDEGKKIFEDVAGDDPAAQNLKKLEAGRIDLLIENKMVFDFKRRDNEKYKKIYEVGCETDKGIYIAFNPSLPENKKVIELMNKFMQSAEGKKQIKIIYEKYKK